MSLALLLGSGLAAGYIAGLIGVGGGVIFAPVLFFYFQGIGISPEVIAPLTIGTSLFCTVLAAISSAWFHYHKGAVITSVALKVGLFSAIAVFLMTRFVTTQPWYDGAVFQVVFSIVLMTVVLRMLLGGRKKMVVSHEADEKTYSTPVLAVSGITAGVVSSAAGVGGGVVLVPAYHNLMHIPIHRAAGTSSTTIIIISSFGVLNYAWMGWNATGLPVSIGYVDVIHGLFLAVPALISARAGVWTAHRINTRAMQWSFSIIAVIIAVRLLLDAFG